MGGGRKRLPGTEAERAEARRARVRLHVQAFRKRQREKGSQLASTLAREPIRFIRQTPGRIFDHLACANPGQPRHSATAVAQCDKAPIVLEIEGGKVASQDWAASQLPSPKLLVTIDVGPAAKEPFFGALLDHYLPHVSTPTSSANMADMVEFNNGAMPVTCSMWVVTACSSAIYHGTDVLSDSILSMALCIIGAQRKDDRISVAGLKTYQRALHRVQRGLGIFLKVTMSSEMTRGFLPLSCLACAMTELTAHGSMENFLRNLDGIALMIQQCGPASLESPVMRILYYEHRSMYVATCFFMRRSCFYSRKAWIELAWKGTERLASTWFQRLLDIAYSIPELMEEYDTFKPACLQGLRQVLNSVHKFDLRLDAWKSDMADSIGAPPFVRKEPTPENSLTDRIDFPSVGVAMSMVYYFAFKIHLQHMILDLENEFLHHLVPITALAQEAAEESLKYARLTCQSLEYWFEDDKGVQGKGVGLFPFDAAWLAFARAHNSTDKNLDSELEFCRKMVGRYSDLGIPVIRQL